MRCSGLSYDEMRSLPPIISPYPSGAIMSTASARAGSFGSGSM